MYYTICDLNNYLGDIIFVCRLNSKFTDFIHPKNELVENT